MNDKPDLKKVMERIAKLLALAGNNPSEAEAAAAAERAQAMLAEYNLSLSDIQATETTASEEIVIDRDHTTTALPWRRPLALAVAKLYFCEYFYTTVPYTQTVDENTGQIKFTKQASDIHNFVGAHHNVLVAKAMFGYLNSTIDRLAKEGALSVPANERSPYRTTFRNVCARRICVRIQKRIDETKQGETKTEGGTNLPALLSMYESWEKKNKDHIQEQVGEMKTKAQKNAILHGKGTSDGYEAGNRIGLDAQVSGSGAQKRIGR